MPSASWTASAYAETVAFFRRMVAEFASVVDRKLAIVVRDGGSGMSVRHDSPGPGLGLALLRRVADGFEVCVPPGGGTELRMCFAL